ncbi:MAG: hypothetical protein ABIH69_07140, partial [bacterium]
MKKNLLLILLITGYCLLITSSAHAKEYDGVWFMGYNLKSKVMAVPEIRQAVSNTIDKQYIVKNIVSEEVVPESIVP